MNLLDADRRGLLARLQNPWAGNVVKVILNVAVIYNRDKVRHAEMTIEGSHPHRKLIAEVAHGGEPHTGNAQVLTQGGCRFHIELVQSDHAINFFAAGEMGHRLHDVRQRDLFRKVESLVEALAWPISVAQFFGS